MNSTYSRTFPSQAVYSTCPVIDNPQTIRLLDLLPGEGLPINCRLRSVSLDLKSQYTALSYCWGDTTCLQPIYVNKRLLGVTRNLHPALCYLRSPTRSLTLWVDAICINQSDDRERNCQVAIMRRIYEGAKEVLAWLGEPNENSDQAMDYLASQSWSKSQFIMTSDDILLALCSLFSRPYWARVWVLQEIAVGKKVDFLCGYKSVGLAVLAEFLAKRLPAFHPSWGAFWNPRRLLRLALNSSSDMILILREAAPLKASILVDKIYALRGLFPQELQDLLAPDYEKPFQVLLHDLVSAYIHLTGNVEFLCTFSPLTDTELGTKCPSWLPDIRATISYMGNELNRAQHKVSAAQRCSAGITCTLSESSLCISGRAIGRLRLTMGPFETKRDVLMENFNTYDRPLRNASFIELREVALHWLRNRRGMVTEEDLERAFYHMVAGERAHYSFKTEGITSLADLWRSTTSVELLAHAGTQFERVFQRLHGNVFFVTENGHPGIGPCDAREGDVACVVYGCSLPVLLRREVSDNGVCLYSFVGPVYVDGAMNGEYASGESVVYTIT